MFTEYSSLPPNNLVDIACLTFPLAPCRFTEVPLILPRRTPPDTTPRRTRWRLCGSCSGNCPAATRTATRRRAATCPAWTARDRSRRTTARCRPQSTWTATTPACWDASRRWGLPVSIGYYTSLLGRPLYQPAGTGTIPACWDDYLKETVHLPNMWFYLR